jgi:integrase/recombinase XerC/integrase/recombinase XerD
MRKTRDKALILVLLRTGMRIGEVLSIKMRDIHLKEKKVLISESSKNRIGRVVYLSDDTLEALKKWIKEREPAKDFLFYSKGHDTMSYNTARSILIKYLNWAGLEGKGYSLHCLRHTFASELLSAGIPLESLQQLMGHSNVEVTRRYARLTNQSLEQDYFNSMQVVERGGINGTYRNGF